MEKSFVIEAPSRALPDPMGTAPRITVNINIWCTDRDGDYGYDIESLWDEDRQCSVRIDDLSVTELAEIDKQGEALAYENADAAYQEYCEERSNVEYERWKDEQMFKEHEE